MSNVYSYWYVFVLRVLLSFTNSPRHQADFIFWGSSAVWKSFTHFSHSDAALLLFGFMRLSLSHSTIHTFCSKMSQVLYSRMSLRFLPFFQLHLLFPFSSQVFTAWSLPPHFTVGTVLDEWWASARQSALYHCWKVQLWFHHTTEYFASCSQSTLSYVISATQPR